MIMAAYLAAAILALGLVGLGFHRIGGVYLTFRGKRVITCPQCGQAAAVDVAAGRVALTAVFSRPALRLRGCSRWPEHRGCGRECLKQIEAAPEDCLLQMILKKWYEGKSCVCCGNPVGAINWVQHKPCVMSPALRIFEWKDIRPENVPHVLETYSPVCWNCLVAETHTS